MFTSLLYKEWIKTRRIVILLGLTFICFVVYTFLNTAQMFRLNESIELWAGMIINDFALIPAFEWLPLLSGLLLATAQFVPEMVNKRMKLTLHLPLPDTQIMACMLFYGIVLLAGIYLLTYLVLVAGLRFYYPQEIVAATFWRSFPWFMAGIYAYLLAVWVCIEPIWRQKIVNAVVGACALPVFFIPALSGAYQPFTVYLLLFAVLCFSFPFYSAIRFKEGAQS